MFTIIAAFSPSKDKNLAICFLKRSTLWSISSLDIILLISVLPEGSPIVAVPPPIKIIGLCPAFCICDATIKEIKCPTCKLSAVGSNPI